MLRYRRITRTVQTPIFAILALAVFVWGLQYKISLYRSVNPQQTVLGAKLFSQKQRVAPGIQKLKSLCSSRPASAAGRRDYTTAVAALLTTAPTVPIGSFVDVAPQLGRLETKSPYLDLRNPRAPHHCIAFSLNALGNESSTCCSVHSPR